MYRKYAGKSGPRCTWASRSGNFAAKAPHAATTKSLWSAIELSAESFCGPTGASAISRSRGRELRSAKRLPTHKPPYPQRSVKPMQRRIVGSSTLAAAVLGFSIMNMTIGLSGFPAAGKPIAVVPRFVDTGRALHHALLSFSCPSSGRFCAGPSRTRWSASPECPTNHLNNSYRTTRPSRDCCAGLGLVQVKQRPRPCPVLQ